MSESDTDSSQDEPSSYDEFDVIVQLDDDEEFDEFDDDDDDDDDGDDDNAVTDQLLKTWKGEKPPN